MSSRSRLALLFLAALVLAGCARRQLEPTPADASAPARSTSEEACVDAWLAERHLDAFGSPEGTMYAGGTPLFDERTGETTDRLVYVYRRHPEAKQACAR